MQEGIATAGPTDQSRVAVAGSNCEGQHLRKSDSKAPTGSGRNPKPGGFVFHPLTAERWSDLEELFGIRGACGGCWCMTWRLARSQFVRQSGDGNKRAFKRIVAKGEPTGILAYSGDRPVGWCALAPRQVYTRLARSRVLKPVDAEPVWSITCFFIEKSHRRQGLSARLLEAAVRFAKTQGAKIVEGYPYDQVAKLPDPFVWTGLASAFRKAGFVEVARRSSTRPIMRYRIGR
ncbi:MAG: GNAT family N-acetyltransferase [candidate division Zixibacteria bacterium]|nr:GNAT family N-acetyltransferase [candidate division Zixibacteria bacterium]